MESVSWIDIENKYLDDVKINKWMKRLKNNLAQLLKSFSAGKNRFEVWRFCRKKVKKEIIFHFCPKLN